MTILDELRAGRWFGRLDPAVQHALADAGRIAHLHAGQWVYGEGDDATGIAIVLGGTIRLEAAVGERLVLIGIARAGAAIGQSHRRGGGPRIVTARAGPASRVMTVGDAALERIGAGTPLLWRAISELVYGQLTASVHSLAQVLALPPRARIAARLLALAEGGSGDASLTQADLAELCGLSRKAVNAHLAALEAEGAIGRGYGRIVVRDTGLLERLTC